MADPEPGNGDEKLAPIHTQNGGLVYSSSQFQQGIKSRHVNMIAVGGTIGTGLFVGAEEALAIAGPAPLLGVYIFVCILIHGIITATSEMAAYLPVPGCSMAYYGHRFVSRSLGFAMRWLYVHSFGIIIVCHCSQCVSCPGLCRDEILICFDQGYHDYRTHNNTGCSAVLRRWSKSSNPGIPLLEDLNAI